MYDEQTSGPIEEADSGEVEGHRLHGSGREEMPETTNDDVEGHRLHGSGRQADEDDDVEGHRLHGSGR